MKKILTILLFSLLPNLVIAAESDVLFHLQFNDLSGWTNFSFPTIRRQTKYQVERDEDNEMVLLAEADDAASCIFYEKRFSPYDYPHLSWRWKVMRIFEGEDLSDKKGDDTPIRVGIVFEYDRENLSFWKRLKLRSAKLVHGEYPPHSSSSYVWSSKAYDTAVLVSAYTEKTRLFLLQSGIQNLGKWITEERNVLEDYRAAFGEDPPRTARLVVMSDTDDTGEASLSFVDDIKVFRKLPVSADSRLSGERAKPF